MKAPRIECTGKEFKEALGWRSWDDRINDDDTVILDILTVHFERENMRVRVIDNPLLGPQVIDIKATPYLKTYKA